MQFAAATASLFLRYTRPTAGAAADRRRRTWPRGLALGAAEGEEEGGGRSGDSASANAATTISTTSGGGGGGGGSVIRLQVFGLAPMKKRMRVAFALLDDRLVELAARAISAVTRQALSMLRI